MPSVVLSRAVSQLPALPTEDRSAVPRRCPDCGARTAIRWPSLWRSPIALVAVLGGIGLLSGGIAAGSLHAALAPLLVFVVLTAWLVAEFRRREGPAIRREVLVVCRDCGWTRCGVSFDGRDRDRRERGARFFAGVRRILFVPMIFYGAVAVATQVRLDILWMFAFFLPGILARELETVFVPPRLGRRAATDGAGTKGWRRYFRWVW